MTALSRREIVRRAIEFESPPRIPFWQHALTDVPDDVCDCWEMDRAKAGYRCGAAVGDCLTVEHLEAILLS